MYLLFTFVHNNQKYMNMFHIFTTFKPNYCTFGHFSPIHWIIWPHCSQVSEKIAIGYVGSVDANMKCKSSLDRMKLLYIGVEQVHNYSQLRLIRHLQNSNFCTN